jgi:CheY-like chemotaxis protein
VKFTERGEVVLTVAPDSSNDSEKLQFRIRDTGIGIPEHKKQRLFKAFTQLDSSTTRQYGGTGLGLAIAAQIAEQLGGQTWVESQPGRGSTFYFTTQMRAARPGKTDRGESSSWRGRRALIVDDHAATRESLQRQLCPYGMTIEVVESGKHAVERLAATDLSHSPIDLVLLDADMPEMDGFECAARIRRQNAECGEIVMMLSTCDRNVGIQRCRESGLAGYLTKPVRHSELSQVLAAIDGQAHDQQRADTPENSTSNAARPRNLRLLVTDDNVINQRLAVGLLEKRGHRLVVAGNGREALQAIADQDFDAVLLDVEMPEMDGYQTAAAIRAAERNSGRHLPIIAMTAHARKGDREKSLAAGMDGYISKPLRPAELYRVVEELANQQPESKRAHPEGLPIEVENSRRSMLDQVGGDPNLLRELIQLFLRDLPGTLRQLRSAVQRGDVSELRRAAHRVQGPLRVFDDGDAGRAARELEKMGEAADLSRVTAGLTALEKALARLELHLRELEKQL